MLPPDNFQEDPKPVWPIGRRRPTSGSICCLRSRPRFRLEGTTEAIERLEATLATMGGLERFRGHFLNWYDTRDLRPLDPRYVSTVDSGNSLDI